MRRVGILGGMGPEATILLMRRVLAATGAADDAGHIPLIVDQNPQVPSRIAHLIEGTGEDPGPVLAAMARRLVAAGAEALAMPCNTAHHYADKIRDAVRVPFLDMVEIAADHAARLAGRGGRVGILASPAVRRVGLFDRALAARGLTALHATDEAMMLAAIRGIKAGGPTESSRKTLRHAASDLGARGADLLMIACTEFSLIADAVEAAHFDTLDLLAGAIRDFSKDNVPGAMQAEPMA